MKDDAETKATLGDADLGYLNDDVQDGDLSRGHYDAAPRGNYEGSLEPPMQIYDFDSGEVVEKHRGTRHAGHIEPDGFERTHGDQDQYGFVRRPTHRSDVERN